jgi:small multidrug resistance family-3 protein
MAYAENIGWERIYMEVIKSLFYFVTAGILEIGGGYLIWLWLREGRSLWYALFGAIILVLYGVIPTLQPANFGRIYAAYGGIFIVLSLLWGWKVDQVLPDRFDIIGGAISLVGVLIIMYWPRG